MSLAKDSKIAQSSIVLPFADFTFFKKKIDDTEKTRYPTVQLAVEVLEARIPAQLGALVIPVQGLQLHEKKKKRRLTEEIYFGNSREKDELPSGNLALVFCHHLLHIRVVCFRLFFIVFWLPK